MDAIVGPDGPQGDGELLRVARLDQDPGAPDEIGQGADGRRDDRRPAGDRVDGGEARRIRDGRQDGGSGAPDQPGDDGRRELRRVAEARSDVVSGRRTSEGGAIVRAGADEQDPRRPDDVVGQTVGAAGLGQGDERPEEGAEILAGVVPAGVDEVALRQPEALALAAVASAPRLAPSCAATSVNAGRGASGTTRSRSARMWRTRRAALATLGLTTRTAAASRSSCARRRWPNRAVADRAYASGSSHGARSSRVATIGRPDAIGSGLAPAVW